MTHELWGIRHDYVGAPLDPDSCDPDPIAMVERWLRTAVEAKLSSPNAMTLATVDGRGRPAARIVLLKDLDARGFTFYTNYDSRKGKDLAAHAFAALVLFWEPLHRQIRIEGSIERVSADESDAYFASRPRGSQIGAIASPQSQPIDNRKVLEDKVADIERVVGAGVPERPVFWGGYLVVPDLVELWQGQASRLHDRVRYRMIDGAWVKDRLAP